jgi:ribose transport system permease protein
VANIFGSQAVLFVLTMAVLIPLVHGDFDLSLGAAAGICAMTISLLNVQHHVPVVFACLAGLAAALSVGAANALFVVRLRNDPFIITLGTMTVVIGIVYAISGGATVGIVSADLTSWVFTRELVGIPIEFFYGIGLLLVVWYVLAWTPLGQRALFVGQSRDVARLSGIRVDRMRVGAFLAGGLIAGVAGILYVGTTGSADPATGTSLLLPAYAAAFLGSTSIRPGRFNAPGAAIAVYFLATGVAGLQLLGAQDYVQQLFYGGALVIAVTLSNLIRRR